MNTLLLLSFLTAATLPNGEIATQIKPASELVKKRKVITDFTLTNVKGKKVKLIKLSAAEAKKFNDITTASVKQELDELDKKGMKATEIFNALKN